MLKHLALTGLFAFAPALASATPSKAATDTASYAVATYRGQLVDTLGKLVSFPTVAQEGVAVDKNPHHIAFKQYLKEEALRLGLGFDDYGSVARVSLGSGDDRVGVITHGDVQPVDASKWKKSPFEIDRSEKGRLVGRGTEDDKGPIATALYAMKAIKDKGIPLKKRIELYVYMAEESDWDPLVAFLKTHTPPQVNITIDADYPVVTAEKGYGSVNAIFAKTPTSPGQAAIVEFGGGAFGSQVPEDASATIVNATPALQAAIVRRAARQPKAMRYTYQWDGGTLKVGARGVSAHSSKPEGGVNAISMLADALAVQPWPDSGAGSLVNFLNGMLGTGLYGEKFGKVAYRDKFMGPMTFVPTVIRQKPEGMELNINLRRPQGKSTAQLTAEVEEALNAWQARHVPLGAIRIQIGEPWLQKDAPHIGTLLDVFSHYTGIRKAKPISIGGGTNSRLFPNAVSFGPAMPNVEYTAHSEHEFITEKQLYLNLQMYTAVLVELAR
jgi:dipeptidase D